MDKTLQRPKKVTKVELAKLLQGYNMVTTTNMQIGPNTTVVLVTAYDSITTNWPIKAAYDILDTDKYALLQQYE